MTASVAERAWCVIVPHHPRGAGQARWRLASELAHTIRRELLADAVTVVAELAGNSIRHAAPLTGDVIRIAWRLRYAAGNEVLEVRVTDGGASTEPRLRDVGPAATGGRGLAIVDALASSWGFDRDGFGQCVWAELSGPIRPSGRSGHAAYPNQARSSESSPVGA